jgi:hypothetical protein
MWSQNSQQYAVQGGLDHDGRFNSASDKNGIHPCGIDMGNE